MENFRKNIEVQREKNGNLRFFEKWRKRFIGVDQVLQFLPRDNKFYIATGIRGDFVGDVEKTKATLVDEPVVVELELIFKKSRFLKTGVFCCFSLS